MPCVVASPSLSRSHCVARPTICQTEKCSPAAASAAAVAICSHWPRHTEFIQPSVSLRCCSVSVALSAAAFVGDRKCLKESELAGRSRTDEPLSAAGKDEKKVELTKVKRESGRGDDCAS